MFYGVINENYDHIDYLEIELENSLLFFKSLDVIQESGIQIVQESFSDIVERVKDLWKKFKEWIKDIWEKIKLIFTKKKNIIKDIKEINDTIQKGEVKKEEDKKEETKEIKWYEIKGNDIEKFSAYIQNVINDEIAFDKCLNSNEKMNDNIYINDYCNKCKDIKNENESLDIITQFFIKNTFTNKVDPNQFAPLADKITKASEKLENDCGTQIKETNSAIRDAEKTVKEILEASKNNSENEKSSNCFRAVSSYISTLHSYALILKSIEAERIKCLSANRAALKEIVIYFS